MILPDVNLLVYAHNEAAPFHAKAKAWWEEKLNNSQPIALSWFAVYGFIRLVTHPAVLVEPLSPGEALARVETWVGREHVELIDPGPQHLRIARRLFEATGLGGALTTDTQLAALAIEHQCELCSNDADFGRFPGLRWCNPLS
ncbi:MAG: TA system VapC family ribonuclease toxin [Deltaproteobacteria bacterium]